MRLIDILNKIANGELKEGTEIKLVGSCDVFTYRRNDAEEQFHELIDDDGENIFKNYYMELLTDECELIEPEEPIEELDILEIEDNQNIDNLGLAKSIGDLSNTIREIQHKLNEVIRYINK
jgi:hypothetical protein